MNAHPLDKYVEDILKAKNPQWYSLYRSFNKINNDISLELKDFESFYEQRKKDLLAILAEKFDLNRTDSILPAANEQNEYPDIDEDQQLNTSIA